MHESSDSNGSLDPSPEAKGEQSTVKHGRDPRTGTRRERLPDFFIVGHQKCGTTALYEALQRHPQIYMPKCKEPWFFATELHVRTPPRPEGTPQTLDEYLALFDERGARPAHR